MSLVGLNEAKMYLRVDTEDEDEFISVLIQSAGRLCADVARLTERKWEVINSGVEETEEYSKEELTAIRETMKVAILYTIAYLFEHREEADHHDLILTLRCLLFALREGVI